MINTLLLSFMHNRLQLAFGTLMVLLCGACLSACSSTGLFSLRETHSAAKNSPHAELDGTFVRILPFGARFEIPETWTRQVYKKSLFVSWGDLNELNKKEGLLDSVRGERAVMDSVLPFEICNLHVGEKGWDSGSISDQLRVYTTDLDIEAVIAKVERNGLERAENFFDRASLSRKPFQSWDNATIRYVHAPTHAILIRDIAFYAGRFNDKTIVFVFLHPGNEKLIQETLNSFTIE